MTTRTKGKTPFWKARLEPEVREKLSMLALHLETTEAEVVRTLIRKRFHSSGLAATKAQAERDIAVDVGIDDFLDRAKSGDAAALDRLAPAVIAGVRARAKKK